MDDNPSNDPFGGLPFFGDLARMLAGQGPISWEAARQLAYSLASGNAAEPNPDPIERIRLEELTRVAELHVATVTGLATSTTGRPITVVAVNRSTWAARALDAYRPLFDRLANALRPGGEAEPGSAIVDASAGEHDPSLAWLSQLLALASPVMLGMSIGSMVGHLAQRSFGQYDLPIPRPPSDELVFVPANLAEFAEAWSLPPDDVRLWIALNELVHHAVLGVPHVREQLSALLAGYVGGFRPNAHALEEKLGSIELQDASDLGALQHVLGDPEALLGAMQTPAQLEIQRRLDALVAVIVGYVDWTMDQIGHRLVSSWGSLSEALRRRRIESSSSGQFVERLLGLSLGRDQVERGARFVQGVVERDPDALARLWAAERHLPTPAEVDAPGLWLARLDLPE